MAVFCCEARSTAPDDVVTTGSLDVLVNGIDSLTTVACHGSCEAAWLLR